MGQRVSTTWHACPRFLLDNPNDAGQVVPGSGCTHAVTIAGHWVRTSGHCVTIGGHWVGTSGHCVSTTGHAVVRSGHVVYDPTGHSV
jgi:hypothetical protein